MKQSLQIRLGQQLTMTPQLQQAIRLLQLSSLDLQLEIQQALESNVMLELEEDTEPSLDRELSSRERDEEREARDAPEPAEDSARDTSEPNEHIPDELPVDSQWDDVYDGSTSYSSPEFDDRDPFANESGSAGGLRAHLRWQADLCGFTEKDRYIAEILIDSVADDGYLHIGTEEVLQALPPEWRVEPEEVETVLQRVQRFDPVGVAAREPREALLLQLEPLPPDTPWLAEARLLVDKHLELLAGRQYSQLMRRLKLDQDSLRAVVALIQTLDPHPGARISDETPQYVIPDVFVRKQRGVWQVDLNTDALPKIRVNDYYAGLLKGGESATLRDQLQEARWFLKSLQSRHETLLKVARFIVAHQQGFFEHGEEAMKPLVLREVAEEVEMHESTISRITTQKYMHTPRGTLEFKYFFSSHVSTADGQECSATAIRARIRKLIAAEAPDKPLSDSKLTEILQDEGINVARRTVAKYREAMNIGSSTERKRLA
ncbi:RNA polymerase factor sigma-54 [Alkalilimnicola sp. S0819]|uniref:RNA polymerase factor sigma-54 n=1 Tax=Alkalilimnicola sp. S0819 TaxID=2613922 RepID=UPI0012623A55|nr:RNA polymerase factor sigma-54 [Alkalilimnicola sp. S0819]KAB7623866.1 RNA polymerase factor sigma-54 [Alkalilimnicola sp. S0819]MPQ16696.1 RNA polymerase factor sigma-54 [Alkalilimnicola sp. S0819]